MPLLNDSGGSIILTGFDFFTEVEMVGNGRSGRDVGNAGCDCVRKAAGTGPELATTGTEASGDERAGA